MRILPARKKIEGGWRTSARSCASKTRSAPPWVGARRGRVLLVLVRYRLQREIGVYWYLFSNHYSLRCIYVERKQRKKTQLLPGVLELYKSSRLLAFSCHSSFTFLCGQMRSFYRIGGARSSLFRCGYVCDPPPRVVTVPPTRLHMMTLSTSSRTHSHTAHTHAQSATFKR